jgi:pimeloyl-ACP methyl ester carboxylesterase
MTRRAIVLPCAVLVWHSACPAQEVPDWRLPDLRPATIQWSACSSSLVRDSAFRLGGRLRCGTMTVPLDHHRPETGNIDVALVRVTAADPSRRQGAIFFNPGGPGESPMQFLPSIAQYWADAHGDHPVHGTKRQLADQFDLVGVVPRGLAGGTPFVCASATEATEYNDIVADQSPANVLAMQRYMQAMAAACVENPLHRFINTEQTAYDMEVARRSLGEPRLNYLGYSYGAWLGSWYAAAFPEHVGRVVLDSSMDWTADWDTNVTRSKLGSQARFDRLVGEPAARRPGHYQLGTDVATVVAQIDRLNFPVRRAWGGFWKKPENLLGALTVSGWLRADPDMSLDTLTARLRARRFHAEDATDAAIRNDMVRYAWRLFPATPQPEPIQFDTLDSVNAAVMCNDMAYEGDSTHHQNKISTLARTLPATNGLGLQYHCVFWGGAQATRPPMSRMGAAGDILMVHASLDPVTPLQNAQAAHAATPTARLLVADGIDGHGVFGFTDSACVEHTVGRYLLTGVLPAGREYRCAAVPAAHGGPASGFARPDRVAELRDELAGMRSPFARLGGIRP